MWVQHPSSASPGRSADRRLDPRLHGPPLVAPVQAVVPALSARSCERRALLLPTLALAGFAGIGARRRCCSATPGWLDRTFAGITPAQEDAVGGWGGIANGLLRGGGRAGVRGTLRSGPGCSVGAGCVRLTYPGGRRCWRSLGHVVLDASRAAGIPHASLCGGRGRCSTCRSRIGPASARVPLPSPEEERVLKRVGAAAERSPGLPASPDRRPDDHPAAAADDPDGRDRVCVRATRSGQRAGGRDPVRRHPGLHQVLGAPPAVRRGVRDERVFQGDGRGGRGERRPPRQVHRRRRDGAVRRRYRPGPGLSAGARRRRRDGPGARRAEPERWRRIWPSRCGSASAFTPGR